MGTAISASKALEELSPEELTAGVEVLCKDRPITGNDVMTALKESSVRDAEIAELKAKVASLEDELKSRSKVVEDKAAHQAIGSGLTASELVAKGFTVGRFKAAGVAVDALKDAGFSAEECRDGGYGAEELYFLCADFPLNDQSCKTFDPAYNKLSILQMNGASVITATAFGMMQVASWSPDIYAAPPAWDRAEDGWDIRNRKKARLLRWKSDEEAHISAEEDATVPIAEDLGDDDAADCDDENEDGEDDDEN